MGKNKTFAIVALLILSLGTFTLPLLAQQGDLVPLGKKGEIPFDSPVRVGDVLLQPGTYQVQHLVEGEDHVVIFRKMTHPGPNNSPSSRPGKEVARVKCRVEPLGEKAKHNGMRFGTNAAGEKTVEEIHVQGENVKHLL